MLTKEDYMRLPKERLAELLVERDLPVIHLPFSQTLPCYAPDGICTNPQRELFICSCENTEHQIVFSWFENDDVGNVYATIHLRKKSFWTRLKYGIKYIFGYQCKYGAFDEFIFCPDDARKLKKIARWLGNAKVGGKCIYDPKEIEL